MSDYVLRSEQWPGLAAAPAQAREAKAATNRIGWVDYAKGWSIILVVTMHSALGVGFAVGGDGWLHELVAFAKPFRMPDFFLVAGLFAARAMDRPWRTFLDRKVVHFAYFYALWLLITLAVKSVDLGLTTPGAFVQAYLLGFAEPFGSMWFIHLLPFLFVAVRLSRKLPAPFVLGAALGMHILAAEYPEGGVYAMASQMTGWTTIDSFFLFFVYFLCGTLFSDQVFRFAAQVRERPALAIAGLGAWAVVEALAVASGLPEVPGATFVFGLMGAFAVVALSTLLATTGLMRGLAYCGSRSLTIYLAFFVPMAAMRILLLKTHLVADVGTMSLIVAATAVTGPLVLERLTRGTRLGFLFTRPAWARLAEAAPRAAANVAPACAAPAAGHGRREAA